MEHPNAIHNRLEQARATLHNLDEQVERNRRLLAAELGKKEPNSIRVEVYESKIKELKEKNASGPYLIEELERKLVQSVLLDLVGQLPERLRRVIVARYGLGEDPPCLLKELGEELDLTGERVRQLQQEALAWLRHPTHSWCLRQLVDKNTAADYRRALAQNAALRRSRRSKR